MGSTSTQLQQVTTSPQRRGWRYAPFLFLLVLACCLELELLVLVGLSPLPGLRLSASPLSTWTISMKPACVLTTLWPELEQSGTHSLAPLLFALTLLLLLLTYGGALVIALRQSRKQPERRIWLWVLSGCAALFGLTLLFQPLLFSDDVFTYIFSGRLLTIYHTDPLNTAPIRFLHDPYFRWVLSGRYLPNIYGPLWLCIAGLLTAIGETTQNQGITLLLFKGSALLAHLLNIGLLWLLLHRVAPQRCLVGTLLYAWNPLIIIELAGSGHNDGLLVTLLLLATLLYVHPQQGWREIAALLIFGLAASMNLIALLVAPLYLWFALRHEHSLPRALRACCWRGLVLLLPVLLISWPFWRGTSTFFSVTSAIDMEHFGHSPTGILVLPLHRLFTFAAQQAQLPKTLQPNVAADVTMRSSTTLIFVLIYCTRFSMLHRQNADLNLLFSSCSSVVFWYLLLVSGWFWPWYLLWLLWSVALTPLDIFSSSMLVLSGTALFIYPFIGFTHAPLAPYQAALIFGIPLVYLLSVKVRQWYIERVGYFYDRRGKTTQD